jgi:DNA replication protein DnaC
MKTIDKFDLLKFAGVPEKLIVDLRELNLPANCRQTIFTSQYIHGSSGVGKSVQAAWILAQAVFDDIGSGIGYIQNYEHALKQGEVIYLGPSLDQLFVSVPNLLRQIKATFDSRYQGMSEKEMVDNCIYTHLLVLDDLGTELTTDWAYSVIYGIISERYNTMRPTIITSNYSIPELEQKFTDTRMTSRILGMCGTDIFQMHGKDRRESASLAKSE